MEDPMLGRRRPAREAAMLQRLNERRWCWASGPFRGLGFTFAVRAMDAATGEYLAAALAPLLSTSPAHHMYSIVDRGERRLRRYVIYLDGRYIIDAGGATSAAMYVLWHVNRSVVRESAEYLLVHASAAACGSHALIFPAAAEAGKTTLVAGLLKRGLGYLSDEAVGIDLESGLAHPYPKSLSVDPGSWEVLADLRPQLETRLAPFASDQWQVDPRCIRPGNISGACAVGVIVSPQYEKGATTRLERITRAEAAAALVTNSFNFSRHGAAGLEVVARIVRAAECYRLVVGSLGDASDAVMQIADGRLSLM